MAQIDVTKFSRSQSPELASKHQTQIGRRSRSATIDSDRSHIPAFELYVLTVLLCHNSAIRIFTIRHYIHIRLHVF